MDNFQTLSLISKNLAIISKIATDKRWKVQKNLQKKNSANFSGLLLTRKTVENTEKFTEKEENTEKCTEKNVLKNLRTKNAEKCSTKKEKEKYTEKCAAKKYRKMYKKIHWKDLQTKNSLDFSGLFLGPEKRRKLEKNSRGKKNSVKKYWFFSRKKTREIYCQKLQKKKFCQFFCIFLGFLALFGNFLVIIWLFSTYYLTMIWLFQNGSNEAKKGARQKFVHFWKALTILMLKKYLKSWFIDTILHVFFKKPNFFSKIFFGLNSSRRSKN